MIKWDFNHSGKHIWYHSSGPEKMPVEIKDIVGIKRCGLCGTSRLYDMNKETLSKLNKNEGEIK